MSNTGIGHLSGLVSSAAAAFEIVPPVEIALAPGEQTYVVVRYAPDSAGLHNASIVFATSAGTVNVPVTGNGAVKRRVRLIK